MSTQQSLFLIVVLIVASGFFSMAEIALAASRRIRLRQLAADGDQRAPKVLQMQEQPGDYFTVVQVAQNGIAILGGIIGEGAFSPFITSVLGHWMDGKHASTLGFWISFLLITSLFILFSDILPKRLGMAEPERVAMRVYRPMLLVITLLRPLVWFYGKISDLVFKLLGLPMLRDERITSEDILAMTEAGTQAGVLAQNEQRVIANLFDLDNRLVTSAMTARDRIAFFLQNDSDALIRARIGAEPYSTYPVCDRDIDHVIGYVDAQDLLQRALNNQPISLSDDSLLQKALVIPDRLSLAETLEQFRQAGEDFAVVVNEYSLVVGVVTLNDVMSTVMGDLIGPDDEELIVQRDEHSWLIDGITPIEDVVHALHIDEFPHFEDYDTMAGFLMVMLRRIPRRTDSVNWGGYKFEVMDVDSYRIDQVLVTRLCAEGQEPKEQETASLGAPSP
ncbi:hemolysin family protein [Vandammella animalimorsus]|uniref:Polyamine export protein n=1 Tax=Vandammella animalimorsus TaxID=2029117 RepID=A0A2A2AKM5_9BURK|nr:hemolysin family protein [Vandammella animalimorsus]PAT38376.1 hypothetical protein CK625_02490 [Vandammella animalimorsus]